MIIHMAGITTFRSGPEYLRYRCLLIIFFLSFIYVSPMKTGSDPGPGLIMSDINVHSNPEPIVRICTLQIINDLGKYSLSVVKCKVQNNIHLNGVVAGI